MKKDMGNLNHEQKYKNKAKKIAELLETLYKKEDKFFANFKDNYERN